MSGAQQSISGAPLAECTKKIITLKFLADNASGLFVCMSVIREHRWIILWMQSIAFSFFIGFQ